MKNKTFLLSLLLLSGIIFTSCASSRGGTTRGGHKKGYGCPATAFNQSGAQESGRS